MGWRTGPRLSCKGGLLDLACTKGRQRMARVVAATVNLWAVRGEQRPHQPAIGWRDSTRRIRGHASQGRHPLVRRRGGRGRKSAEEGDQRLHNDREGATERRREWIWSHRARGASGG